MEDKGNQFYKNSALGFSTLIDLKALVDDRAEEVQVDDVIDMTGHTCVFSNKECVPGCPRYSNNHSIDASGSCNMGCC